MNKNWLYLVLLLALVVRAGLCLCAIGYVPKLSGDGLQTPDSEDYLRLACGIASKNGPAHVPHFSDSHHYFNPSEITFPEIFRTPGYPVFLALTEGSVEGLGRSVPTFENTLGFVAVPAQIVFDVALVGLTCWLGMMLVGPRVGLVAGFLQAISTLAVASTCRILSDSLYAFAFTAAVLFIVAHLQRGKWWTLLASAVTLGAACYVRPIAQIMAPLFALALLLLQGRMQWSAASGVHPLGTATTGPTHDPAGCRGLPRRLRQPRGLPTTHRLAVVAAHSAANHGTQRPAKALVFLMLFAACLASWIIRNGVRADYWGFSSVFGDTLFAFAAPEVLGAATNVTTDEARREIGGPPLSSWPTWDPNYIGVVYWLDPNHVGIFARWRQEKALAIIRAHPWVYARLHAKGCLAFWLPGTDVLEIAGLTKGNRGTLEVLHKDGLWAAAKHYFGGSAPAIALAVPIVLFTLVQYLSAGVFCLRSLLGRFAGRTRARQRIPAEVWLLALIVLVSCLVSGTTGVPRFRVPVEPILNVAAAAGILAVLGMCRRRTAVAATSQSPEAAQPGDEEG